MSTLAPTGQRIERAREDPLATANPCRYLQPPMSMEVAEYGPALRAKERALFAWLEAQLKVVVAFSGGVDSTYLAWAAHRALGSNAVALTAKSASLPVRELQAARAVARHIGLRHLIVETDELERADYVRNPTSRCYHCKQSLFDSASLVARAEDDAVLVDGFNADDLSDHRPGHRAAAERGVLHPLADHAIGKSEIRSLSRRAGLPTWQKPQLACLASRIPYGMAVTPERLSRIEALEDRLKDMGFFDVRARLVGGEDAMVRLEVGAEELLDAVQARESIVQAGRAVGFRFVTLDLEGFRSGRMNEGWVQLGGG